MKITRRNGVISTQVLTPFVIVIQTFCVLGPMYQPCSMRITKVLHSSIHMHFSHLREKVEGMAPIAESTSFCYKQFYALNFSLMFNC